MKKLFVILLVTVLTSCVTLLDPPKSNTDYKNIIGKPFKIGNIEVAQYDFPVQMNWEDAKKACADLGEGWKLPSKDELNILYANQNRISGFSESTYWSSTEVGKNGAWHQYFSDGAGSNDYKNVTLYVRAIRALKQSAVLEPAKSKTDYKNIIGKPFKIGNIEVAQYDFPKKMNWNDAEKACADLGEGWKLPSKDELNILYANQNRIGGFANDLYWSSTEFGIDRAWYQGFTIGSQEIYPMSNTFYVRAIRALEQSAALEPDSDGFDRKNIIGKSIKIGNLEIAQYDFPNAMDLEDAKKFCTNLGKGWRLPSKDELNILYQNKVAIGGFANKNNYYWSSTEGDFMASAQSFYDGHQDGFTKNYPGYVRAVRSF